MKKGVKGQQGQQTALKCCDTHKLSMLTVVLTVAEGSAKGQQLDQRSGRSGRTLVYQHDSMALSVTRNDAEVGNDWSSKNKTTAWTNKNAGERAPGVH